MLFYSITAAAAKGSRRYMEDRMTMEQIRDKKGNLLGLFIAVLDGHGGPQASEHVRRRLWQTLSQTDGFASSDDQDVLDAMKRAFLQIHEEMRDHRDSWPLRPNGYTSTAGTTCSCALIRDNKIYTAHCGDSKIVLLTEDDDGMFQAIDLTRDHKPDDVDERLRIEKDGGRISNFTPVARVMWTREVKLISANNNGPERRTETIPFLSIARSLGDYWSYVPETDCYAVSPVPDCSVRPIDLKCDKYLVLMSDGITNVMSSPMIAEHVEEWKTGMVRNMARYLLKSSISAWRNLKADNMSIVCVGLHDLNNNDIDFKPCFDLNIDSPIDERLTDNPREIILAYPQKLLTANPDWDDLIETHESDEDDKEAYMGPGYVNRQGTGSGSRRSSYLHSYANHTPGSKPLYSPSSFRNRLSIQSAERRQSCITLKRPTVRLNSSSFVWKSAESTNSPGLRRLGLYIPLSNGRRAKSSTPSNEEEGEDRVFRQSWPLARIQQQQGMITVVDKSESKLIIRSSPSRTYQIRRVWPSNGDFDSVAESSLQSEENVNDGNKRKCTPKRKCNLEKDELEAKRQNCRVR